jgi:hypothetical protein
MRDLFLWEVKMMYARYRRRRWWNLPSVWVALVLMAIFIGMLIGNQAKAISASKERSELIKVIDQLKTELDGRTWQYVDTKA